MKRTGIFVGSFDPFTIGHDSVVRRALALFDHLVIGVGVNQGKRYMLTADELSLIHISEPTRLA